MSCKPALYRARTRRKKQPIIELEKTHPDLVAKYKQKCFQEYNKWKNINGNYAIVCAATLKKMIDVYWPGELCN